MVYYLMEGEKRTTEQPVRKKTPIFRNIAISKMTINGAKMMIDVDGLPEMPIQQLRISDVIGTGKVGMKAEYTDGLELHNVQLNPQYGPAFRVAHSTNLELDDIATRKPLPGTPVVRLEDMPGAVLRNSRAFPETSILSFYGAWRVAEDSARRERSRQCSHSDRRGWRAMRFAITQEKLVRRPGPRTGGQRRIEIAIPVRTGGCVEGNSC